MGGPFWVSHLFFSTLLILFFSAPLQALEPADAEAIPHVSKRAKENFLSYIHAKPHKAFAIAPGGAWAWYAGAANANEAESRALASCQENTRQRCVLYAKDDARVLDERRWARLWRPYFSAEDARQRDIGTKRTERLFDFRYWDRKGKEHQLSEHRGKITIVHFWGSWCPPCLREFPLLKDFHEKISKRYPGQAEIVMLQVREPFKDALAWASNNGFGDLPLFDSGVANDEDDQLKLDNGETVTDRRIARSFPSSYFIDRNGVILLNHRGPIHDWDEYLPFLDDVIQNTKP